jgi:hypothetical protein
MRVSNAHLSLLIILVAGAAMLICGLVTHQKAVTETSKATLNANAKLLIDYLSEDLTCPGYIPLSTDPDFVEQPSGNSKNAVWHVEKLTAEELEKRCVALSAELREASCKLAELEKRREKLDRDKGSTPEERSKYIKASKALQTELEAHYRKIKEIRKRSDALFRQTQMLPQPLQIPMQHDGFQQLTPYVPGSTMWIVQPYGQKSARFVGSCGRIYNRRFGPAIPVSDLIK